MPRLRPLIRTRPSRRARLRGVAGGVLVLLGGLAAAGFGGALQAAPPALPDTAPVTPAPLIAPSATVTPAPLLAAPAPLGPVVTLGPDDLFLNPLTGRLTLAAAALPPPATALPSLAADDESPAARYLRHIVVTGQAAGLAGVVYDNRDRGHSLLPPALFPALTRTAYAPDLRKQGADFGPAGAFRLPAITFGNSSTAITSGPAPRSLPRLLMTSAGTPWQAWADYSSNALYVYPCHRDHDAWDMYPAAWPYLLVSQGSSGSDQPFLRAVAMILAAFPSDTRARLQAEGLVAPTVQMVFRRAQAGVTGPADYMSGAANPSVFARSAIDLQAMVALANSLVPQAIPPLVRLTVESEDFQPRAGLLGGPETLFDTPSAIARLWRGPAYEHQMVVTTAGTADPNGRPLTFHWVLLRGDPDRVRIAPLDATGSRARISLTWQDPRPAPAGPTVQGPGPMSARIDIGVFADNGASLSAPAFVSVSLPAQQIRRYAPGPDGAMRLAEVDYDANGRSAPYDPLLWWSAPWRDLFHYDAAGRLAGWTRVSTRPDGPAPEDFAADGTTGGRQPGYALKKPGADLAQTRTE